MPPAESAPETATRASIFVRLKTSDTKPRELAWREFYQRYAPVISSYAYRNGANRQQADEVVQDVISGFFEASPRFVYDPKRGRFRAYLRTCVGRALRRRKLAGRAAGEGAAIPVDEVEARDERDEIWEKLWQQQILRRAMDTVRQRYAHKGKLETFLAFEHNVVHGMSASATASLLGMSVSSVHVAKLRVTEKLRAVRAMLEDEEG